MKPKLTIPRWLALKKIEANGAGISDPAFLGIDLEIKGPTLVSLEECEWIERVEAPGNDNPFQTTNRGNHWRVTPAGREAISALPSTPPRRN